MTAIDVAPIVLKDAIVTIDSDDFAAAVSSAKLIPSASLVKFKGLKSTAVFTDVTSAEWSLELTFAQDWVTAGSLSRYLLTNEGAIKAAEIAPQSGAGPSFTMNIVITPGQIGGNVDQVPTATVTLGVQGKPTLVEPA